MLTDFYELTMANGYFENGMGDTVSYFDMFFRNVPDGGKDLLENAMLMVKRMGTGRNRGYGRCKITIVNS